MEKHAKSEIEFTWGKIGWSKRGIVSKTQTNAQTDVLRSANEQTLINYIQTMAASAPEQSTHFKSTGLPRLLGNIIILIVNLVWFLFHNSKITQVLTTHEDAIWYPCPTARGNLFRT